MPAPRRAWRGTSNLFHRRVGGWPSSQFFASYGGEGAPHLETWGTLGWLIQMWATRQAHSKYPPAEPGALFCEPLEAAEGVANAAPVLLSHLKVAGHFHMFGWSRR